MSSYQRMKDKTTKIDFNDPIWVLYDEYLSFNTNNWSPTTLKSETARLKKIIHAAKNGAGFTGNGLYAYLTETGIKPYSIKTYMIRASSFWDFCRERGHFPQMPFNPYKAEMMRNKKVTCGVYKPERLKMDFFKAEELLRNLELEDVRVKDFCLALLYSGLRIHEAYKVNKETGYVIGKGAKERKVAWDYAHATNPSQASVRGALAAVGLKPHSLRKLFVTRLSRSGFSREDIMLIMGWSSFSTAEKYLQPDLEDGLMNKVKNLFKETKKES